MAYGLLQQIWDEFQLGTSLAVDAVAGTSLAPGVYAQNEADRYGLSPIEQAAVKSYAAQVNVPDAVRTETRAAINTVKEAAAAVPAAVKASLGTVETILVAGAVLAVVWVAWPALRRAAS